MTRYSAANCGPRASAPEDCRPGGSASPALNGTPTPTPRTKRMTTEYGNERCPHPSPRRTWTAIAVALVAVVAVLTGELWALHAAPGTRNQVVSELNGTLARVVASSLLIGPAD